MVVEQNIYKYQKPKYSMLARRFVPGDKTVKPGPGNVLVYLLVIHPLCIGAHYPENVKINAESMPKYSMGIRHSEYITPYI